MYWSMNHAINYNRLLFDHLTFLSHEILQYLPIIPLLYLSNHKKCTIAPLNVAAGRGLKSTWSCSSPWPYWLISPPPQIPFFEINSSSEANSQTPKSIPLKSFWRHEFFSAFIGERKKVGGSPPSPLPHPNPRQSLYLTPDTSRPPSVHAVMPLNG